MLLSTRLLTSLRSGEASDTTFRLYTAAEGLAAAGVSADIAADAAVSIPGAIGRSATPRYVRPPSIERASAAVRVASDVSPVRIRTTAGFLAKTKNLSRVGYVFEGKAGQGKLLVTTLRFREHLDEAYPEAIALFDRLLRYASGASFAPAAEIGEEQLLALLPPR